MVKSHEAYILLLPFFIFPHRLQPWLWRQVWCAEGPSRQNCCWLGPHREGRETREPGGPLKGKSLLSIYL